MANRPLVNVRLDPALTSQLDDLAAERGTTRSDLLREGIELVLEAGGRRHHRRGGRQVWLRPEDEDDQVWVGLDTSRKTLCLLLSTAEAEQLLEMLVMWREARRG